MLPDYGALIAETVVFEMRLSASAANLPQKFIDGITITGEGPPKYVVENVWKGENGEPLAQYFEEGTERHWIQPLSPDGVLAFPSGGPQSGGAKAVYSKQAGTVKGDAVFSKGHWVEGIREFRSMKNGFKIGIQRMGERFGR